MYRENVGKMVGPRSRADLDRSDLPFEKVTRSDHLTKAVLFNRIEKDLLVTPLCPSWEEGKAAIHSLERGGFS